MGVVNVTPDSFSDGGVHFDPDVAAAAARRMVDEGAAIVDIGGESTRPGSEGVSVDEELRRVVPCSSGSRASPGLDRHGEGRGRAARARARGGDGQRRDRVPRRPGARRSRAEHDAYVCLMHMQGEPRTMQVDPRYDDVASEVAAFLEERLAFAVAQGIREERICLDPASGSARRSSTTSSSCAARRAARARPAGARRLLPQELARPARRRSRAKTGPLAASVAAAVAAYERGATILRVHDVREHVDASPSTSTSCASSWRRPCLTGASSTRTWVSGTGSRRSLHTIFTMRVPVGNRVCTRALRACRPA